MAIHSSSSSHDQSSKPPLSQLSTSSQPPFFVWKEFVFGAIAGAFGEGMIHPVDTVKTRIQSQAILNAAQNQKSIKQMVRYVWRSDGLPGFFRGITPGITGSLATGATYFGVIESTKKWIETEHPGLDGHWSHFLAGAIGDTLGSFIYVPCEVMKQRMQIQGTKKYWSNVVMKEATQGKGGMHMYEYYSGMFQAGRSILKEQGPRGLYAGYWSTLARDVPFAGLMVTFYEAFKNMTDYGLQRVFPNSECSMNGTIEGLILGGLAGGMSAYLTTPLDVVKTRLQVQGTALRYTGWSNAFHKIWETEGIKGLFRGSSARVMWYVPASSLMFMTVEFLRENFGDEHNMQQQQQVSRLTIVDKKGKPLQEVS